MKITKKFAPITIELETAEELSEFIGNINDVLYTSMVKRAIRCNKYKSSSILETILERITK